MLYLNKLEDYELDFDIKLKLNVCSLPLMIQFHKLILHKMSLIPCFVGMHHIFGTVIRDKVNHIADILSINATDKTAVIDDLDLEVKTSKLHELVFEILLFGRKWKYKLFSKFKKVLSFQYFMCYDSAFQLLRLVSTQKVWKK